MFSNDSDQTHKARLGEYSSFHAMKHVPNYGTHHHVNENGPDSSTPLNGEDRSPFTPGSGGASASTKKKVGLAALVVLIYYEVSGGPFGIEDIVRAGGPLVAILGFSLFIIWVIPEALVTAELSTALPEASGAVGTTLALFLAPCSRLLFLSGYLSL
jgi:hypothetical protein